MRTKSSVKNMISVLIFNIIIAILGFAKVHVFVNGLSNDIYSLNQLFYQIFSYIAITDIGFGLLLNKSLYNAFAKDDKDEINKIYSTSKKFYAIIASIMLAITLILSFFVHYLTKATLPNTYIQLVFIIFIIRNVIDYFFVAPRYVLEADQKLYKINHYVKLIKILETIIEIILVSIHVDYLFVLIPGIILTIIIDLLINKKIYKDYPWLKSDKTFDKKYLKGTRDVIWQKVAGLLNSNTDIILISTFINPITVIIYTSYTYITKFVSDTVYILANALIPSYANLIIKENNEKSYSTFREINSLFLFIATFSFIMFYGFLNSLITFWIGQNYIASDIALILFCLICFQFIADMPILMTINSKGLFKETKKATIIEACLNLIISLVLINKIGLIGVLLGTVISKILTTFIKNPTFIYKTIFKTNSLTYYIEYLISIAQCVIFILIFNALRLNIPSLKIWFVYVIVSSIIVIATLYSVNYALHKSFRDLSSRALKYIKTRKGN